MPGANFKPWPKHHPACSASGREAGRGQAVKYQQCCRVAAARQLGPGSLACTQAGQRAGEGRELRGCGGRDVQGWLFKSASCNFNLVQLAAGGGGRS